VTESGSRALTLKIPGSTSNLGPGLDTLALALKIYSYVTVHIADKSAIPAPKVNVTGSGAESSRQSDQGDLTYKLLTTLLKDNSDLLRRARVTVESDIPLGAGLGASSAAILGALWASAMLQDLIPTRSKLLADAAKIGGNSEFIAASLLGGMIVCSHSEEEITTQRLDWPGDWRVVLAIPERRMTTNHARSVLPASVPLSDAIHNVQRTALLVAAVANHDEAAFKRSLEDRLHQDYRRDLVPELQSLREHLREQPIIGTALSGAGTGVVAFVNERRLNEVAASMRQWAQLQTEKLEIVVTEADPDGMQELPKPRVVKAFT
jgi:homoserine kinase